MRTTIYFFIALFLFCTVDTSGQELRQTIRGRVVDAVSGVPLPGATIIIEGSDPQIGTITDEDGNFRLENVLVGRHDFRFSFIGYEPAVFNEVLVGSAHEVILNVSMQESVTGLEEIKVSPHNNKSEPKNNMAMISARQISVEEASRYAGGMDDPARVAASFAGVSSSMSDNAVVIRGNNPRGVLWRMEGVDIPTPAHFANLNSFGGGGLTSLSAQMLSNSDFFTGAFPAQYGNALSGVFDLNIRNGNNQQNQHFFSLGTIGIDVASEGPFSKKGKSSYLFNYRYSTFSLIAPLLPEDAGGIRYQDLSFKINLPTKNSGTFSLWAIGSEDISGMNAEQDIDKWEYERDREEGDSPTKMGAIGLNHKVKAGEGALLISSLSASANYMGWDLSKADSSLVLHPFEKISNTEGRATFATTLNKKFGKIHNNSTGLKYNRLFYDQLSLQAPGIGDEMNTIVDARGGSGLAQVFTQSKFNISPKLILSAGLYGQYFELNDSYSIEPRAAVKWRFNQAQSFEIGYGLHSQLEPLSIYLAENETDGVISRPNENLGFSKANHLVFGYSAKFSENLRMKIEPYYQRLYNIPVIEGTYFSMLNIKDEWFINDPMINEGTGTNIGIDFTFERFLNKGYYYLSTFSLSDSKYTDGSGIERPTRFNRGYVFNLLGGKEWEVGRNRQNLLSLNGRINILGGERIIPVDENATHKEREIVLDYERAFEEQIPDVYYLDITVSYRRNRPKYSGIWSAKVGNLLGQKEFYGYKYNLKTNVIEPDEEAIVFPNISYKIEF